MNRAAQDSAMMLTLQQAADATGIKRTMIMRAIRSGKMSGTKDADGQWTVDVAEIARVYPLNNPCVDKTQLERIDQALAERVHQAERQLGELIATLNDMREQRDSWQREAHDWKAQAQSACKMLADQRPRPWWWQLYLSHWRDKLVLFGHH